METRPIDGRGHPVDQLPDDTLVFLLGSRHCETDLLVDIACTTKENGKGTGLGLSQVYGFIAQSGGDVLIDSEPGKGTVVSMYLPVARAASGDADTFADPALDTVLVVEDEPELLDATAELFRGLGYEVLTASNGSEAMEALGRRDDIRVLFTDVVMPKGMDGIQLARSTRNLHPKIRSCSHWDTRFRPLRRSTAISATFPSSTNPTGWPISSGRWARRRSRCSNIASLETRHRPANRACFRKVDLVDRRVDRSLSVQAEQSPACRSRQPGSRDRTPQASRPATERIDSELRSAVQHL
ncbi:MULTISPECIES: response regulator [unclassified Caballeronia]|uniref:response regulator n=1 Tax=unclassified Caballeronia TaxID=2646786 RepID=UPI00202833CF|nr:MULTISPECIES: response regulator [unclassified Caballeronia]